MVNINHDTDDSRVELRPPRSVVKKRSERSRTHSDLALASCFSEYASQKSPRVVYSSLIADLNAGCMISSDGAHRQSIADGKRRENALHCMEHEIA